MHAGTQPEGILPTVSPDYFRGVTDGGKGLYMLCSVLGFTLSMQFL